MSATVQIITPSTIVRVALIISRMADPHARNRLAIGLAEALHEGGWQFDEAMLLKLCRFHWCEFLGCRVCREGR